MKVQPRSRRSALSLIEVMVYLGVLTVLMLLAYEAYYRAETTTRRLAGNSGQIIQALKAGEQWRADMRRATGPVRGATGDSDPVLLRIPREKGEVRYEVSDGKLWRREEGRRALEPLLDRVASARFIREPRQPVAAWRWELELSTPSKSPRLRPLFTFLAPAPPSS
jgi:type II secretory pathway component PulJ